jgi:hypothetical protein
MSHHTAIAIAIAMVVCMSMVVNSQHVEVTSWHHQLVPSGRPRSHFIRSVPFHRQVTEWSCGDGSLEMVLSYWAGDIDQRELIDVARTGSQEGWCNQ